MFNLNHYLFTFLISISVFSLNAQTYKNVDASPRGSYASGNLPLDLLNANELSKSNNNTSVSNAVYVRQVGNNNQFETNLRSLKSDVGVYQYGNSNLSYIDLNAVLINEQVLQFGNNNVFYDLGLGVKLLHDGKVIQTGSNQRLYLIGNNSISDRLRVSMSGNNQTVIIRNFQ